MHLKFYVPNCGLAKCLTMCHMKNFQGFIKSIVNILTNPQLFRDGKITGQRNTETFSQVDYTQKDFQGAQYISGTKNPGDYLEDGSGSKYVCGKFSGGTAFGVY